MTKTLEQAMKMRAHALKEEEEQEKEKKQRLDAERKEREQIVAQFVADYLKNKYDVSMATERSRSSDSVHADEIRADEYSVYILLRIDNDTEYIKTKVHGHAASVEELSINDLWIVSNSRKRFCHPIDAIMEAYRVNWKDLIVEEETEEEEENDDGSGEVQV